MTANLDQVGEKFDEELVGWLTTVTPEGQPKNSIVWFLRDGDDVLIYSRPGKPKLASIAANPRVAFNLRSDRHGHSVVTIEGAATIEDDPIPAHLIPQYVDKYSESIKANGWTNQSFAEDYSVLIRISVDRLRTSV